MKNVRIKENEPMRLSLNELSSGSERCTLRRERNIATSERKGDNYFKSVLIKGILKTYYEGGFSHQQETIIFENEEEADLHRTLYYKVQDMVTNHQLDTSMFWFYFNVSYALKRGFLKIKYPSALSREIHAEEALNCIFRYINSEKRTPFFYQSKEVELYGILVDVSPDFVFFNKDGEIEVVKIKASKPKLTQRGKGKKGAENDLGLYAMLKYAEQLVPYGEQRTIKASYYYLRKDNDRSGKESVFNFDADFFDTNKGKNIISLSKEYNSLNYCVYGKEPCSGYERISCPFAVNCQASELSELDLKCKELFENFAKGSECDEEDCETCDFYQVCRYKKSPIIKEKVKVVKSLRDLSLTPTQEKAVSFMEGLCRINAGAGAGKTLILALRVVTLMMNGVSPKDICTITFTNTGAEEMKTRIQLYNEDFGTGEDVSELTCTTFNAFGDSIVKQEYTTLGFTREPRLIDDIERSVIISKLLNKTPILGLDYRNFNMNTKNCKGALHMTRKIFQIIKSNNFSYGDEKEIVKKLDTETRFLDVKSIPKIIELFMEFDSILKEECLIEFADQELLVFDVLRKNPYYFDDLGFKHIIVDEFQDSNKTQIELIKALRNSPKFESLMVVGDDSQAIFGFRDTSPENIINFFDLMGEEGEDIYLLENHRSTPEIIEFANKINQMNKNRVLKDLIATRPHGKPPVVRGFWSRDKEYEYIIEKIQEKRMEGLEFEDIAFIASNKYELLEMADRLTKAGIPSVLLNPEVLIENSRVLAAIDLVAFLLDPTSTKSALSYLNAQLGGQLLQYSDDDIKRMIEAKQMEAYHFAKLPNNSFKRNRFHEMLESINPEKDEVYDSFLKALKSKVSLEKEFEYCTNFLDFGTDAMIKRECDYPGVVLTTAHSSKGLEWPVVFNSITKYDSKDLRRHYNQIEEKRRLLFVSATRARDELYITGLYIAFGSKEDEVYNQYLRDCFEAMGGEFAPNPEEKELS